MKETVTECFSYVFLLGSLLLCVCLLSVRAVSEVRLDCTSDMLVFSFSFSFFAALTVILSTCVYLTSSYGPLHTSHWFYS